MRSIYGLQFHSRAGIHACQLVVSPGCQYVHYTQRHGSIWYISNKRKLEYLLVLYSATIALEQHPKLSTRTPRRWRGQQQQCCDANIQLLRAPIATWRLCNMLPFLGKQFGSAQDGSGSWACIGVHNSRDTERVIH